MLLSGSRSATSGHDGRMWRPVALHQPVCAAESRKSHALSIVRARAESQVIEFGGERGTRTLDLGIMSATL
jgi:hypothetical protein